MQTKLTEQQKLELISEILKAFDVKSRSDLTTYARRWDKAMEALNKYLED